MPETLEETYTEIEKKISSQKGNSPLLAQKALMWIMCSSTPLSPDQLVAGAVIGLQLATDHSKTNDDVNLEIIIQLCHNLVVLDHQLDVVRFAHLSVFEYLEKRGWDTIVTHTMAVEVCIYTLNNPNNWVVPDSFRTDSTQFLYYSTEYWPDHFQRCNGGKQSNKLPKLLREFLGSFGVAGPAYLSWWETGNIGGDRTWFKSDPPSSMLAAAAFGIGELISDFWDLEGLDANLRIDNVLKESVLYVASRFGHDWVVQRLLERGADISIECGYFGDALQVATHYGFEGTMRLLLENGAEANTQRGFWGSALQAAANIGHEGMIRLLLDHGADINMPGGRCGSPLHAAACSWNYNSCEVVRMFLDEGADINAIGKYGTVLQLAALEGKVEVIRLLVSEIISDKSRKTTTEASAASSAVRANSLDSVRAIVEAGGEINIPESTTEKTPLQYALVLKSIPIIEYLILHIPSIELLRLNLRDACLDDIDWARDQPWFSKLEVILKTDLVRENQSLAPRDVLQARLILHKGIGLPIAIADTILDLGEYWVRTTISRQDELVVNQNTPELAYIEIPIYSRLKSPVRKIVFHMKSHDQGIL